MCCATPLGSPAFPGSLPQAASVRGQRGAHRDDDTTKPSLKYFQCFNPRQDRRRVHDQLNRLRRLRNRIVHHEPILHWNLQADHDLILGLLGLLSPETKTWVEHHSRVLEVLALPVHRVDFF